MNRKPLWKPLWLAVVLLAAAVPWVQAADTFRFVVISDTHIIDESYECCESGGPDSSDTRSLQDSSDNLRQAVEEINALDPPVDFVVITGDIVHDYHKSFRYHEENRVHMDIAADILSGLTMPWYGTMGNHDNFFAFDTDALARLWAKKLGPEHVGEEAYLAFEHKGFKFLLLNQYRCGKATYLTEGKPRKLGGCLGKEQFALMKKELAEGKPTLLFAHQPGMDYDFSTESHDGETLGDLVEKNGNVQAFFMGHTHNYLRGKMVEHFKDVKGYVVSATRFNPGARFVVEAHIEKGKVRLVNTEDFRWGTR